MGSGRVARAVVLVGGALAVALLGACRGPDATPAERAAARQVVEVLTSRAGAPYPWYATAVFNEPAFTTTYSVSVGLPDGAENDQPSLRMRARWEGPNCGDFGVLAPFGAFRRGVMEASGDLTSELLAFQWVHPHPPCGTTPDHSDVAVKVTVSNPSGSFECVFRTAASGAGTCTPPARNR